MTREFYTNVDLNNNDLIAADTVSFNTATSDAPATGKIVWDSGEGSLALGLKGGNVDLSIGTSSYALCYNGTGSTIAKGSTVYINGAQGNRPTIALADADLEETSSKTLGIVAEAITNGAEGFVCTFGIVKNVNTSSFTAGQALYVSSTAGGLTATKPTAPVNLVFVGYAISINASSGRIFVNPQNGYELDELHDVVITSVQDKDILQWENSSLLWKNKSLSAAGIMSNPMTTAGDVIYGGASGTPTRLGIGTAGQVLKVNSGATAVEWGAVTASAIETVTTSATTIPSLTITAPTVVNTSSTSFGNSTSGSLTLPASMQAGDLVIAMVGSDTAGDLQPDLPTGWTNLGSANSGAGNNYTRLCYKVMGATVDSTVTFTNLETSSAGVAIALRNWTGIPVATSATGTTGLPNPPSVTTSFNNSRVIVFGALDDVNTTLTASSGYANSTSQSSTTTGQTVAVGQKEITTAGAEDPAAFTGTGTDAWVAYSVIVNGAATDINFDVSTSQVNYYTSNLAFNPTFNFRGNASTSLNTYLATGESVTCAVLLTNGSTAYSCNFIKIDGTYQYVRWIDQTLITGDANSIDAYVFTIIKTGAATFTVLGSKTQYA